MTEPGDVDEVAVETTGVAVDPAAPQPAVADAGRFPVALPAYTGSLEHLVALAQRGEVDLAQVPVAEITSDFRRRVSQDAVPVDPRDVADFLTLAARLVSLKAARLLPDGPLEAGLGDDGLEDGAVDDPGARLAEYRLFKAAAEALLAEAAEQGVRSFLGIVAAEVVPAERLSIPAERLAAAFRAVIERLPEIEPFSVETVTYSVEDKVTELRDLLRRRATLAFEDVFSGVSSRLEAVACFLALLELVKSGQARVDQSGPFGGITVHAGG